MRANFVCFHTCLPLPPISAAGPFPYPWPCRARRSTRCLGHGSPAQPSPQSGAPPSSFIQLPAPPTAFPPSCTCTPQRQPTCCLIGPAGRRPLTCPPPAIHWCSAGIAQRLKAASLVSKQAAAAARQQADAITTRLDSLLGTSSVLLLPTTPFPGGRLPHAVCAAAVAHTPCVCVCVHHCVRSQALPTPIPPSIFSLSCAIAPPFLDAAPPLGSDLEAQPDNVGRLMALTSIASLAGLPQV